MSKEATNKKYLDQVKTYVQAGENLKRKLKEVRLNLGMRNLQMSEDFKPIIEPLNQSNILLGSLNETLKSKNDDNISILRRSINMDFDFDDSDRFDELDPNDDMKSESSIKPLSSKSESSSKPLSSKKGDDSLILNNDGEKEGVKRIGDIAQKYLNSDLSNIDNKFGLKLENDLKYIGDSEVKIDHNDIIVKDKKYEGTNGLWVLITSKEPDDSEYTNEDYNNYANIIISTNAYFQNNDKTTKRIKSSTSYKYKNVIRPILLHYGILQDKEKKEKKVSTGSGISKRFAQGSGISNNYKIKTNIEKEYVYWNNIGELKDRLNLLLGENAAGNDDPKVHNEIQ